MPESINVEGITLVFPEKRTTVKELIVFEEPDPDAGIFGTYIEVADVEGEHWVLNDNGYNWIHPLVGTPANRHERTGLVDYDPDWNTIAGTFVGELWPEYKGPTITARKIINDYLHIPPEVDMSHGDDYVNEVLDHHFGILLDTELQVT